MNCMSKIHLSIDFFEECAKVSSDKVFAIHIHLENKDSILFHY